MTKYFKQTSLYMHYKQHTIRANVPIVKTRLFKLSYNGLNKRTLVNK